MAQFPNVSLAILVKEPTGSSGTGKSYLESKSLTSAKRLSHSMSHLFGEIIIISDNISGFERLGFPVHSNTKQDKGDLAQIHFALNQTKGSATLVVSTDLDFVTATIATKLASIFTMKKAEVVIPKVNENLEPLFAIYSREGLSQMSELLMKSKSLSIKDYLEGVNTQVVVLSEDEETLRSYSNTNSPFEIEEISKKSKSKKRKDSGDWFA